MLLRSCYTERPQKLLDETRIFPEVWVSVKEKGTVG